MKMQYLQYGSPTAELFAASYNNRSNKTNIITLGVRTYGYTHNTGSSWLKSEENQGIYNKSNSSNWWLASPGGYISYDELYVKGVGYLGNYNINDGLHAVRPLVCISTSVFNSKYGTEVNLVDE